MNLVVVHNLVFFFTLCTREVNASHPEKRAHHHHAKHEKHEKHGKHHEHGNHEKKRKGKDKASDDYQQNVLTLYGNLTLDGISDNTSHTILENSLEAKNGTTVEYEVGLVRNDRGGVAYHLTFAKKAPPAKLAETDIRREGDQVDGAAGEGEGQVDQAQGEGHVDQGEENVARYTEYWYGNPPLRESGPKIKTGNGERFKPQQITYQAAGKGNHQAADKGNHGAAVKGDHDAAVTGDHDVAVKEDHDIAVKDHDAAVKENHDVAVKGYHDAAIKGDQNNHKLKMNQQQKV